MDEEGVRALIRQRFPGHGGQKKLAAVAGVSQAYVCLVLSGKRPPGRKIVEALGMIEKKTVTRVYIVNRVYTCADADCQI